MRTPRMTDCLMLIAFLAHSSPSQGDESKPNLWMIDDEQYIVYHQYFQDSCEYAQGWTVIGNEGLLLSLSLPNGRITESARAMTCFSKAERFIIDPFQPTGSILKNGKAEYALANQVYFYNADDLPNIMAVLDPKEILKKDKDLQPSKQPKEESFANSKKGKEISFVERPFNTVKCNIKEMGKEFDQVSQIQFRFNGNAEIGTFEDGEYKSYEQPANQEISANRLSFKTNGETMNFQVRLKTAPGEDPASDIVDFSIIESSASSPIFKSMKLHVTTCYGICYR